MKLEEALRITESICRTAESMQLQITVDKTVAEALLTICQAIRADQKDLIIKINETRKR